MGSLPFTGVKNKYFTEVVFYDSVRPMNTLRFRIPDRVFVILTIMVMVMTWALLIWIFPDLPPKIPTHFGPAGLPDGYGDKSWWLVAFPALVQTGLSLLFWLIYRHPQYANIPSTVLLTVMPEPYKGQLFALIQHMLVVLLVLMNILFAHITLTTISVALELQAGLNVWLMAGILIVMFSSIALYTVRMYRLAKIGAAKLRVGEETT